MTRRSATWVRWLGWTVVFGLLFAGVMAPFVRFMPNMGKLVLVTFLVLTLVAAFAIGVRFPSPRWPAVPPVAIVATVLAILALPESGPAKPGPMGNMTPRDEFVFVLVWGGWAIFTLLALA